MKQYIFFLSFFLFLFMAVPCSAQKKKTILGLVENNITHEPLAGTRVLLLNAMDSTVLDTAITSYAVDNNRPKSQFGFQNVIEGNYLLRFEKENYETQYKELRVTSEKRGSFMDMGRVLLSRKKKDIELAAAGVKATRVKIYSKGDTIIYNADAFQLAEGSMLDALIRQIPGAELKDDGRILVNGKRVESLLLNGKDFFKGDNTVMLDNLPSYMVNNIKVYDKQSDRSTFLGRQADKKQLVMDVNLKRQYSIGWIANAEVGKGDKERYLGRFFALRFTPQSRISFYGVINNLNEFRKPGQNGEWSPADLTKGLTATKQFGVDYSVDDKTKFFKIDGSAQIEHLDINNYSETSSVNFLTGGDTYGLSNSYSNSCNTSFRTNHSLQLTWDKIQLNVVPNLGYNKYHNTSASLSGIFLQDFSKYSNKAVLDSLFVPNAGAAIRNQAINSTKNTILVDGYNLSSSILISALIKTNQPNKAFFIGANANYGEIKQDHFSHYQLEYPSIPNTTTDFRNQYGKTPFTQNYNYAARGSYFYFLPNSMGFESYVTYQKVYNNGTYHLYRLDRLEGWGEGTTHPLGELPSVTDYMRSIDKNNSYTSYSTDYNRCAGLRFHWQQDAASEKLGHVEIEAEFPLSFKTNELKYQRAAIDTSFSRHDVFFNPSISVKYIYDGGKRNVWFNYDMNTTAPSMLYLIRDYRDDANPLFITMGNVDLRNTQAHNWSAGYGIQIPDKQHSLGVNVGGRFVLNEIAMGSLYNKETGVRTTMPENVNGNWNIYGVLNYSTPLDKPKRLALSTYTSAQYYSSVDLMTIENTTYSRSKVNSLYLTETLNLDYRIKNIKVGTKLSGTWVNAMSGRVDFTTINAADFNYGLTGQIELPWSMQLSTDLTVYSRRGYDDKAMNTDDLVWNARMSKRIMKGRLTFIVDGFDILGNLSNVSHTINTQGRTETFRNVIPSYVMLHAIYRLNLQPKKRPGEL
ncbi:MAG: hypothetical protein RR280_03740 [Bacteroidaceae bacterium]